MYKNLGLTSEEVCEIGGLQGVDSWLDSGVCAAWVSADHFGRGRSPQADNDGSHWHTVGLHVQALRSAVSI